MIWLALMAVMAALRWRKAGGNFLRQLKSYR
jgi:hypothetical protein